MAVINATYINGDYGCYERMEEIKGLPKVPVNFFNNYEEILMAKDIETLFKLVHNLIKETRAFFNQFTPVRKLRGYNYNELSGWCEEARYTFRRIAYACKNNKFVECLNLSTLILEELR